MPFALLVALAGSLLIHAVALFGPDLPPFGETAEPLVLQAELKPLPPAPNVAPKRTAPARPKPRTAPVGAVADAPQAAQAPVVSPAEPTVGEAPRNPSLPAVDEPSPPMRDERPAPRLPAAGVIRFVLTYGDSGLQVGRAEHRWQFTPDGHYRLHGVTETMGLVALFKTLRYENESVGRLTARGLRPDTYRTLKNGKDANENADFDWEAREVMLSKDGSRHAVVPGTQDILSLSYQFAWLPRPEEGARIGVVIGKKYDRFPVDAVGEEMLDTPAGRFRTLHLRVTLDTVTEIWIALDRYRLPVKIRYTDKKGDVFEQLATELGSEAAPAPPSP